MNKEYQVFCGNYRSFIIKAKSKKQALERFDEASKGEYNFITHGFTLKHVTNVVLRKNKNE